MKSILSMMVLSALLAGCGDKPRPPYADMVEYRLSTYSDDQIRAAYVDAQTDAENTNKKNEEINQEMLVLTRDANEKARAMFNASNPPLSPFCGDIAYRVRHINQCTRSGEYQETEPVLIEKIEPFHLLTSRLYGECLQAKTIKQAVSMSCLPQSYKAPPQKSASR